MSCVIWQIGKEDRGTHSLGPQVPRTLLERNKMRIAQRRYNLVQDISKERGGLGNRPVPPGHDSLKENRGEPARELGKTMSFIRPHQFLKLDDCPHGKL